MSSLAQVIRRTVQVCGSKTASRFNGRARSWTEFQERISRLAGGLHGLGLKEGDRAACLALNSDRYMEFYFGVDLVRRRVRSDQPPPGPCRDTLLAE